MAVKDGRRKGGGGGGRRGEELEVEMWQIPYVAHKLLRWH